MLIFIVMMSYHLYDRVTDFMENPLTTEISYNSSQHIHLPLVHICPTSPARWTNAFAAGTADLLSSLQLPLDSSHPHIARHLRLATRFSRSLLALNRLADDALAHARLTNCSHHELRTRLHNYVRNLNRTLAHLDNHTFLLRRVKPLQHRLDRLTALETTRMFLPLLTFSFILIQTPFQVQTLQLEQSDGRLGPFRLPHH